MKVMVLIKANADSEAGVMPSQQLLAEMGAYNEELAKAGIMLGGDGLHPSSKGVRIRFSGQDRTVINGPFAETKELLAGYWLWQVQSMDEAIAWLKRCPCPMDGEPEVEIRPVFSAEDFGEAFTPELQAQEDRIRATVEQQQSGCAGSGSAAPAALAQPRVENGPDLLIAGLQERYTYETRTNIPVQWERFQPYLGKVPGQQGNTSYGVCWNADEHGFDYLSGVEVHDATNLPGEFKQLRIPAQRYAVFTHPGHISTISETLQAIWSGGVAAAGFTSLPAPTFERYTADFNPQTGLGGVEIWVPIQ